MGRLLCVLLLSLIGACTSNLVKNPGGETAPFTNEWTIVSGKWTQRGKAPLPQEGKAYFFPSVAAHAELFQDVDISSYSFVTDLGLMQMKYKAYMRAYPQRPADQSYQVVEFRNENNMVVDSFKTAHYDSTRLWVSVSHDQVVPKGSRSIRIRLLSDRYNGSNNDGYHDQIVLTLAVSPWVYVLVLIILFVVLWFWFKKRRKQI